MTFQATIRYGTRHIRYLTLDLEAEDLKSALEEIAETLPDDVAEEADLVEIRQAADPDEREYLE